jgi:signal transduction histidine kinase
MVRAAALSGCRLREASAGPYVEFTLVPPAEAGGTDRMATITGFARGARPGQRIVLYARSGAWYVQPYADKPFTIVLPDASWTSTTHLGTEYAALLVDPDHRPPPLRDAMPAAGSDGVSAVTTVPGVPAVWNTWWFRGLGLLAAGLGVWALHRLRLHQVADELSLRFEERLAERTLIAQHLYDTLLQGLLGSSMQLGLAVDQLPEDSPHKPHLARVVGMMAEATEEGRRVLQGLRSSEGETDCVEDALARIRHELAVPEAVAFRVRVDGTPRPLHPIIRDEVYRIGREALVNAFHHSSAAAVDLEVGYSPKSLRVVVRDDGRGMEAGAMEGQEEKKGGLAAMRRRAERLGGRLRVRSRAGAGTEVELSVPGGIAFRARPSPSPAG